MFKGFADDAVFSGDLVSVSVIDFRLVFLDNKRTMKKAAKLAVKERSGFCEVVGRVHDQKVRERFELPSDKVRRRFEDKADAIRWAADVESYSASLGLKRNLRETSLTPEQLREAETAFGLLDGEGIRLTDCVREYLASGVGLRRYRLLRLDAIEREFLDNLDKVQGLSARSIEDKANRLRAFRVKAGAKTIQDFSVSKIEKFLARSKDKAPKVPLSLQTKKNDRAVLHALGVYLIGRGYLDRNPVAAIRAPKPHWKVPEILTPEQAESLIFAALHDEKSGGGYMPWFAVCLFAGLRPQADTGGLVLGENVLLGEDKDLREIRVFREKRRGVAQRVVPIPDNLYQWLMVATERELEIKRPPQKVSARIRAAAGVLDIWDEDIMRHSYATYQLGSGVNEADLSTRMGNSVSVLRQRYVNLAKHRKEDAAKYWAIVPPK